MYTISLFNGWKIVTSDEELVDWLLKLHLVSYMSLASEAHASTIQPSVSRETEVDDAGSKPARPMVDSLLKLYLVVQMSLVLA